MPNPFTPKSLITPKAKTTTKQPTGTGFGSRYSLKDNHLKSNSVKANVVKAAPSLATTTAKTGAATATGWAIGTATLGVGMWAIGEAFYPAHAAKSSLSDIDPDILKQYSPAGAKQTISPGASPGFTGGQTLGAQYVAQCNWNDNTNGTTFGVGGSVRDAPIKSVECYVEPRDQFNDNYFAKITSGEDNRTTTNVYRRPKSLDIDPNYFVTVEWWSGTPDGGENPPLGDAETTSDTSLFNITPYPLDNYYYRDSSIAGSNFGFNNNYKLGNTGVPRPKLDRIEKLDQSKIINDLKNTLDVLVGGKANASDLETVKAQLAETNQKIDSVNLTNGLNKNVELSKPIVNLPQAKAPNKVKADKDIVTEPIIKTEYEVNGKTAIKVKTTTTPDGVVTVEKTTSDGKVISLKRTVPSGLKITDLTVEEDPLKTEKKKDVKIIGTPNKTGTDVDVIPSPDALKQTPPGTDDKLEINDLAKIAALIAATPLLTPDGFAQAFESATCDSANGGCLKSGVTDPIVNNQNNLTNLLQGFDLGLVATINSKLGDAIPGGIGGYLKKAWEVAQVDKIINLATLITSTHNAAMLSRNFGETIGEVVTQSLSFLNIKSPTGENIDVNEIIGKSVKGLIESLVPENIRTNVSETWLKVNRIHAAAVGVASAITATKNAVLEVQEITSNWIAEIGNNMQEQGILEEDSFPWMNDNNNFTNPYTGFLNKLNNAEEVIGQASSFINSVTELKDSVEQINTSKTELSTTLNEFSAAKAEDETTKVAESTSPDIDRLDLIQLEADEI